MVVLGHLAEVDQVRRRKFIALLGFVPLMWPLVALAQQSGETRPFTPEAFTSTLSTWATKHKIKKAIIVVRRGGRVVHRAGIGGADPATPVHLASLSKAITGACIATLVRHRKLDFETPLSRALAKFFREHGRPHDRRIDQITIGQLLTHRGGFPGVTDREEETTRSIFKTYLARHSSREPPKPEFLAAILQQTLSRDPGVQFAYSNSGYQALGAVIEEVTGRTYADYCNEAVLKPAGARGDLDPVWAVRASSGGWRMAGGDYLAFLEQLDPARAAFGARVRDWMLDPNGKTTNTAKPPSWYGLGMRMRNQGNDLVMSHTGTWRARATPPDAQGPRNTETSTLAFRFADGTSWFVHSVPVVRDGARHELERELLNAYQSLRRWR